MSVVAVIGTGGTIACEGFGPLDYLSYLDAIKVRPIDEVLDSVPVLREVADVEPVSFTTLSSRSVGPPEWVAVRRAVRDTLARDDVAGVVLTHGTATLEETSFFLHLTVATDKPLVVVGAQRLSSTLSSDVPLNLVNAVRAAASAQARGAGALVVMNDAINSAREVTKNENHRVETMQSPGMGPLGVVDADGAVLLYRMPTRRHTANSQFADEALWEDDPVLPRVDVVMSYGGADGAAIDACVAHGAKGLVVAGLAPGVCPPRQQEAVERALEAGVAVVQGSRARGRVVPRASHAEQEIATADNLNVQSARILLQLALHAGVARPDLQSIFDSY